MAEVTPDPLICLDCGMLNPPPRQSCKEGRDHFVGTVRGCRWCGRLLEACREHPCTPEAERG